MNRGITHRNRNDYTAAINDYDRAIDVLDFLIQSTPADAHSLFASMIVEALKATASCYREIGNGAAERQSLERAAEVRHRYGLDG